MSFELKPDERLRKGIRRMARKQMDAVLQELSGDHHTNRDELVHEARKSFKKIRALLRLVRPLSPAKIYRRENYCFRDAARPLTEVRDARILIETHDKLMEHFKEHLVERTFNNVRQALQANLRAVRKRVLDEQNAFPVVTASVEQARRRVKDWTDMPNKWSSVGLGFKRVYGSAREAFQDAAADPTVEKLHEWRKQTKYLRYQLEALRPLWVERLDELTNEANRLGDLLGDDHDLAVLRQMLTKDPEQFGDAGDKEVLVSLIDRRRAELTKEALSLGERFFQDRPSDFESRLRAYWKTWRAQTGAEHTYEPLDALA